MTGECGVCKAMNADGIVNRRLQSVLPFGEFPHEKL